MPTKNILSPILGNALLDQPRNRIFSSGDMDEVRSKVGEAFKPHRFAPVHCSSHINARLHQFSLGQVSMHRLKYGGSVDVDPECLEDFYLVQMPIAGRVDIRCGQDEVISHRRQGVVLTPTHRLKMRYDDQCDQLMLRINRQELEQVCSRHIGHALRHPVEFRCDFDWQRSSTWLHMLEYIIQLQKHAPESLEQCLISRQLEELVISTLLSQQPNNYSSELNTTDTSLAPRHVKRVEEYIEAHAQEALTPTDLAGMAGVSVRTLYAGFKDFRHMSPMEFLRSIRLQRVHDALMQPNHQSSVTDTAMYWGFTHMGRFSQEYQKLFGEKPSETKRKAQA